MFLKIVILPTFNQCMIGFKALFGRWNVTLTENWLINNLDLWQFFFPNCLEIVTLYVIVEFLWASNMPSAIWCSTFFDVESFSETCIISTTLKPLMSVECQLGMCSCTSSMVRTRLCILRKSGLFCCLRDQAWFLFSTQKPHFNCKRGSGNICQLNMLLYVAYESEDKLICCNLVMQRFSRNTLVFFFCF